MVIGGRGILYLNAAKEVPDWKALDVDLVIDVQDVLLFGLLLKSIWIAGANRVFG